MTTQPDAAEVMTADTMQWLVTRGLDPDAAREVAHGRATDLANIAELLRELEQWREIANGFSNRAGNRHAETLNEQFARWHRDNEVLLANLKQLRTTNAEQAQRIADLERELETARNLIPTSGILRHPNITTSVLNDPSGNELTGTKAGDHG
jgi:hypothetical protein